MIGGVWMKNDYYEIAYTNLRFLEHAFVTDFYNDIAVNCQQVVEKMLKSVIDEVASSQDCEIDRLMKSHNLRALYDEIHKIVPYFVLDRGSLSMLKDYYFDAKYPGENFVTVTREECQDCVDILYTVIEQVNKFREKNNLSVYEIKKKSLIAMNFFE